MVRYSGLSKHHCQDRILVIFTLFIYTVYEICY